MNGLRYSDLNPAIRSRVEAVCRARGIRVRKSGKNAPGATCGLLAVHRRTGPKGPNATEAEFNRLYLGGQGVYEAITLRLPGGSRYTPDWLWVDEESGMVHLFEVKGAWRFPSEGRALTAFREARAAFPMFRFAWWAKTRRDGWVERHEDDAMNRSNGRTAKLMRCGWTVGRDEMLYPPTPAVRLRRHERNHNHENHATCRR